MRHISLRTEVCPACHGSGVKGAKPVFCHCLTGCRNKLKHSAKMLKASNNQQSLLLTQGWLLKNMHSRIGFITRSYVKSLCEEYTIRRTA